MRRTTFGVCVLACGLVLVAGCSHESADWKTAATADTAAAYQQFLSQHPKSVNVPKAQARLQQLQEDHDWQVATASDTGASYQQFLQQHPDSPNAQEARIRLENFSQAAAPAPTPSTPNLATGGAARAPGAASSSSGAHYVQLGAFGSRERAESHWKHLSSRFSRELGTLTPRYVAGKAHATAVIRLQVAVSSRAQGKALCLKLRAHGESCVRATAG